MTVQNLLFCAQTLCMNYVTNTFLLVRSSVRSKQLLCFLHGQCQKSEQKPTTKNFVGFHNHSPLLTMVDWSVLYGLRFFVKNIAGNGYEARQTSKEQTRMPRFMLQGSRPCTIFCFAFIHYAWIAGNQNVVNNYCVLCTVKAKKDNKNIQQRTLLSFTTIPLY